MVVGAAGLCDDAAASGNKEKLPCLRPRCGLYGGGADQRVSDELVYVA